jgi:hypothetical protein
MQVVVELVEGHADRSVVSDVDLGREDLVSERRRVVDVGSWRPAEAASCRLGERYLSVIGSNFIVYLALTVSCCVAPEGAAAPLAGLLTLAAVQATKSGSRTTRDTRDARFTRLPFRQRQAGTLKLTATGADSN